MATAGAMIDDARFAAAHRHLLEDRTVQFDLPAVKPPDLSWVKPLVELLSHSGPFWRIAFWALVVLLVVLAGRFAWRVFVRWQRRETTPAERPDWRPETGPARALLAEADALAAAGDFAAAVHLVLLRSVEQIAARRPGIVVPALTSRDIACLPALPSDVARAFAFIGGVVETGLFGARTVDSDAWTRCRTAYADVAVPAWR